MGSTKIVVLVLVLVVVIFVVFVIYGVGKNRSRLASDDPKQDAQKFNKHPPPAWVKKLDSLFGISGPKLKFRQMKPSTRDFDLLSQPQHTIEVLPDKDNEFRKATFRITKGQPGCATIRYNAEGNNVDKNLKEQNWPTDGDDRGKVTFWILKTGGRLTFSRSNPTFSAPCTVQLE